MTPSDLWTLIGLGLGTIGAVLLAYDVVYGAGNRFRASVLKTQLETLRSTRKFTRGVIEGMPKPPWTPAEIKQQLDKEEGEWGPRERELAEKAANIRPRYEDRVVTFGAYGVLMIVGGFLLQIVGLLLRTT